MAKTTKKKAVKKTTKKVDNVRIRMYCLGTGDCFVLKFCSGSIPKVTMMIDCGSCKGKPADFRPYLEDLAAYVKDGVDVLVVTHEHNDHVNGFAKCPDIFENLDIKEAWFGWTENPKDPGGRTKELFEKRNKMKLALSFAVNEIKKRATDLESMSSDDFYQHAIMNGHRAFLDGLDTLAEINLPAEGGGEPLAGMVKIRQILKKKKVPVKYLEVGDTETIAGMPEIKFHVLGPPYERDQIFKDGKIGTDVYKKKLQLNDSSLAVNSFLKLADYEYEEKDLPFSSDYLVDDEGQSFITSITQRNEIRPETEPALNAYYNPQESWRRIEMDWLNSSGALALRLNSHINNTSLVLAMESENGKNPVLLFPGDAEFGSWESWHLIKKWKKKGKNDKHFVEDLLNRTVFYKVGHHLSYNGTALEKGINMMESDNLAAMATLDRRRISVKWKSTMPNKFLMQDLIKRCKGRCFIMDEFEIRNAPSKTLDPSTISKKLYETKFFPGTKKPIYIQYTCKV